MPGRLDVSAFMPDACPCQGTANWTSSTADRKFRECPAPAVIGGTQWQLGEQSGLQDYTRTVLSSQTCALQPLSSHPFFFVQSAASEVTAESSLTCAASLSWIKENTERKEEKRETREEGISLHIHHSLVPLGLPQGSAFAIQWHPPWKKATVPLDASRAWMSHAFHVFQG